jgi:hypothetical protein
MISYSIRENVKVHKDENTALIVNENNGDIFEVSSNFLLLIEFLTEPKTIKDLQNFFKQNFTLENFDKAIIDEAIYNLKQFGILKETTN